MLEPLNLCDGERNPLCVLLYPFGWAVTYRGTVFHLLQERGGGLGVEVRSMSCHMHSTALPPHTYHSCSFTDGEWPSIQFGQLSSLPSWSLIGPKGLFDIYIQLLGFCLCFRIVSASIACGRSFWHLNSLSLWIHMRKFLNESMLLLLTSKTFTWQREHVKHQPSSPGRERPWGELAWNFWGSTGKNKIWGSTVSIQVLYKFEIKIYN